MQDRSSPGEAITLPKSGTTTMTIADEIGILCLVDIAAYAGPTHPDPDLAGVPAHIAAQTAARAMLAWDMGDGGGEYRIALSVRPTGILGHRSMEGGIAVTAGVLHLLSHDQIAMAAAYADETMPSRRWPSAAILLDRREARVRIIQTYDPDGDGPAGSSPHLVIEILGASGKPWSGIAWTR